MLPRRSSQAVQRKRKKRFANYSTSVSIVHRVALLYLCYDGTVSSPQSTKSTLTQRMIWDHD